MASVVEGVAVIFLIAGASFALKRLGFLSKKDGEVLLTRVLFYVGIPVLIYANMSVLKFTSDFPKFFLSAIIICSVLALVAFLVSKVARFERKTAGTFIMACQIMNTSMFAFSFFFLLYGDVGLSRVLLLDFGNALMLYTLGYFIAVRYSGKAYSLKSQLL